MPSLYSFAAGRFLDERRVQTAAAVRRGALALEQKELLKLVLAVGRVQLEKHVRVDLARLQRVTRAAAVPGRAVGVLSPVVLGHRLVRVRPRVRLTPEPAVLRTPVAELAGSRHLVTRLRPADAVRAAGRGVRRQRRRRRRLATFLYGTQGAVGRVFGSAVAVVVRTVVRRSVVCRRTRAHTKTNAPRRTAMHVRRARYCNIFTL